MSIVSLERALLSRLSRLVPKISKPSQRRPFASDGERGAALLVALWGVALLGLLVSLTVHELGGATKDARAKIAIAQAAALADGAVEVIMMRLESDSWAPFDIQPGQKGWACQLPDDAIAIVWIADEAGKVDINAASPDTIAALLVQLGQPPDRAGSLTRSIVSFATPATSPSLLSAEITEYQRLGLPDGPKKAPFQTIYELDQVAGMTSELLAALLTHVTVHSHRLVPNPPQAGWVTSRPGKILASGVGTIHVDVVTRANAWSTREVVVALKGQHKLPQVLERRNGVRWTTDERIQTREKDPPC